MTKRSFFESLPLHTITFANSEPITDPVEILVELNAADRRENRSLRLPDWTEWHIEIEHIGGPYDMSIVGTTYLKVHPDAVRVVQKNRWVSGIPMPGYTDDRKLRLNENSRRKLREEYDRRIEEARGKLIPGEHGQSSIYNYRGIHTLWHGGDPRHEQRFYCFQNPLGAKFAVFQDGEVRTNIIWEENSGTAYVQ